MGEESMEINSSTGKSTALDERTVRNGERGQRQKSRGIFRPVTTTYLATSLSPTLRQSIQEQS